MKPFATSTLKTLVILTASCSPPKAVPADDGKGVSSQPRTHAREPLRVDVPPGAAALGREISGQLENKWAELPSTYRPRTRHLRPDGTPRYTNRLFLSSSPYLLQHAHNPTHWFPWSNEAFEEAERLKRPVLLSVGYATCHWCHVMEEESFEDLEVAGALNAGYVPVKVDREERPDVDAVYMRAVHLLTGSGGWPMTVWLKPDRQPFFGGTYFPARDGDRGAQNGFLSILRELRTVYDRQPGRVAAVAAQVAVAVRQGSLPGAPGQEVPPLARIGEAVARYAKDFDSQNGGLRGAPKFPSRLPIRLLLRHWAMSGDEKSRSMVELTLEKMAAGGLYDIVGGGFHRYSTDEQWRVPHFEKMLYDNALLVLAYLEGYQVTGRESFARVVRQTLAYLERDMAAPEGAFYAATDADSPGPKGRREEGRFFTWTASEISEAVGPERGRVLNTHYGVKTAGNFEGRNVLWAAESPEDVARKLGISPIQVQKTLADAQPLMLAARSRRPAPLRDEKILASWNGLAMSAFARAGLVLNSPQYTERARWVANFLLTHLKSKDGSVVRSYGRRHLPLAGYLDDYAFLIAGLLDLFEASGDPRWFDEARALDDTLASHFEDRNGGGYYLTAHGHEELLARDKPFEDGAEPSGNSVQAMNLERLFAFTSDDGYQRRVVKHYQAFTGALNRNLGAAPELLAALAFHHATPREIVIATPGNHTEAAPGNHTDATSGNHTEAAPFLDRLFANYHPHHVLIVAGPDRLKSLAKRIPPVEGKVCLKGRTTAYVCVHGVCGLPTTDPAVFARQLASLQAQIPPRGVPSSYSRE